MSNAPVLAAALLAGALAGCFGGGTFHCETNDQCNALAEGTCQPDGLCSYPDSACQSGQSYGESSGDQSGQCVGGTAPDGCFGAGMVKPCFPSAPTGDLALTAAIDTDTSELCSRDVTAADGLCVIAAERIRIEVPIAATGGRPLVLVAVTTIEISGGLDVASHRNTNPPRIGAGADPATCRAGTGPMSGDAGGGGAGGSFGGRGGAGGTGAGTEATPGGIPGETQAPATLRGGCPGQAGVKGMFGRGGHGGGAVYLIANTAIVISAPINASGEGGLSGTNDAGGAGGGGSGGMIGLDSPAIMSSNAVFANGGSGGEGSGEFTPGNDGPEPNDEDASPATGSNAPNGGNGGAGGAGGTGNGGPDGSTGNDGSIFQSFPGGGGGGGGGTGVIKVYRGTLGGRHSPRPS